MAFDTSFTEAGSISSHVIIDERKHRDSIRVMIIRVAVGSTNPCKIEAVREAFEDVFVRNHQQNEVNVKIVISSYSAESGNSL